MNNWETLIPNWETLIPRLIGGAAVFGVGVSLLGPISRELNKMAATASPTDAAYIQAVVGFFPIAIGMVILFLILSIAGESFNWFDPKTKKSGKKLGKPGELSTTDKIKRYFGYGFKEK